MKITITLFVLILGLSSCLQAKTYPKKENNLLGYWKLVKAETNGRPNSPTMMDRTHEFKSDGIFEGRIFV